MSDMKCPICGQELRNINLVWFCENESCRAYDWTMEEAAWQELIRTKKQLEIAIQGIKTLGEYDPYKEPQSIGSIAQDIIEQITALEQKE